MALALAWEGYKAVNPAGMRPVRGEPEQGKALGWDFRSGKQKERRTVEEEMDLMFRRANRFQVGSRSVLPRR